MSSRMLRSGIQSEILYLPVPSRHGKERRAKKKKEIIPLELVQYQLYNTITKNASPSPTRVYLALFAARLACKRTKRYWRQ